MPSCKPTIVPRAIAYIREHGPQTIVSLCKALGYRPGGVAAAVAKAVRAGHVVVINREYTGGRPQAYYGLPQTVSYPRFSAGEWVGYCPSGTDPYTIQRAI